MNNKGFVASSLIYSFFVAILLLMTLTINNYIQNETISSKFSEKVRENIDNPKPIKNPEEDTITPATNIIEYDGEPDPDPPHHPEPEQIIEKPAPEGATCTYTFAYDGTDDDNYRYVGTNPCNYALFNNEIWRIIGVMHSSDNFGRVVKNVKIIRKDALGDYSWDSSQLGIDGAVNSTGINDWTQADLMKELNEDYLNALTENQMWYNGQNNQKEGIYDYTKGLTQNAQKMIEQATWYLGGQCEHVYTEPGEGNAEKFYSYERGRKVWNGSTEFQTGFAVDAYMPRSLTWTGKVGLIYPSDYGFAVGGSVRNLCLDKNLQNDFLTYDCYKNDWLSSDLLYQWTLTPYSDSGSAVLIISPDHFYSQNASSKYSVRPTVYLKSKVGISRGNGTPENPYVFSFGSN